MATSFRERWNKYPEGCDTPEKKDAYRKLCLIPCVHCRMTTINLWNKEFISIVDDGGETEHTFADMYCPRCGTKMSMGATCSPPQ